MLLNVVVLSLFLQNAVGMAASRSSDWLTTELEHARLKREVIEEANSTAAEESTYKCPHIDDCLYLTHNSYYEVVERFSPSEIYEEAPAWCNSPSLMQVCWRDECDQIDLRNQIEFKDTVIRHICQDLDSFGEVGACFSGSLGQQIDACYVEARNNLDNSTSTDSHVAFKNDFTVCVNNVIGDILVPCQKGTKDFLMRFIDFIVSSKLDLMGV